MCRESRRSKRPNRNAASTANRSSRRAKPAPHSCNRRSGHNLRSGWTWLSVDRATEYPSGKIDDDFDSLRLVLERLRPLLDRYAPRDQFGKPALVGALQNIDGVVVMLTIGIDAAEHGIVVEHHGAIEQTYVDVQGLAGRRDADQADDAAGCGVAESVAHHARRTGALHQYIGLEFVKVGKTTEVESAAELADKLPLAAPVVMIEHVHIEPALRADQCGEKTDRAGAGDQEPHRRPSARTGADALGMIPGLGDDAGRLDQHAVEAERGIELDQKVRLDTEKIRAVAVALLDAALGVAAVAAHIPFADGATRTRHRIGPAHDTDDKIARFEAA